MSTQFARTATPVDTSAGGSLRSATALATRNLRNIKRLPAAFFPALLMPVFQTIAFSGTYYAITLIEDFPTDRSINWFLPLGVLMGSAFSGVGVGFSSIRDLETGFYDRLRMTPTPRRALLVGPLMSGWVRCTIVFVVVNVVGFAIGARPPSGIAALLPLYVAGIGIATIGAGWGLGLAYRFKDMRAAALMQLTIFLTMFLTSAQTPLNIMQGWLYEVARRNPVTYILDLGRQGFLEGISWGDTWPGLVAIVGLAAATLAFARRGLAHLDR
jgi:ABC-2 type transport system permease protein